MITAAISNQIPLTNVPTAPVAAITKGNPFAAIVSSLLMDSEDAIAALQPQQQQQPLADKATAGQWLHFVLPLATAPAKNTKSALDPQVSTAPATPVAPLQPLIPLPIGIPQPVVQLQQLPIAITPASTPKITPPTQLLPAAEAAPLPTAVVVTQSNDNLAFAARLTEVTPLAKPIAKLPSDLPSISSQSLLSKEVTPGNADVDAVPDPSILQKVGQGKPDSGKQDSDKSHEDALTETVQAVLPAAAAVQHAVSFSVPSEPVKATAPATATPQSSEAAPLPSRLIPEPAAPVASSQPVRDLSFHIGAGTANQVDVRIQDRAGEVRVAVHSSDPELTTDMRQQLGDLVVRLDRAGYHSETFKPTSETQSAQSSSESSDSGKQDSSGDSQQQQQEQPQGRQRKDAQPKWLQEMNGSFGSKSSQGARK